MSKRGLPALAALISTALVFAIACSSALATSPMLRNVQLTVKNWSSQDVQLVTSDSTGLWSEKPQAVLRPSQQTTVSIRDAGGFVPFGFKVMYKAVNESTSTATFAYGWHVTSVQEYPVLAQGRGWLEAEMKPGFNDRGLVTSLDATIRDRNYNKGV